MSNSIYSIYKITHIETNKSYIGRTVKEFKIRWSEHKSSARRNYKNKTYLHRSMQKHGIFAFETEIISTFSNLNLLKYAEKFFIKTYDTFNNGYNLTEGGETNPMEYQELREKCSQPKELNGMWKRQHSEETKKQMSDSHKGRHGIECSEEKKTKIKNTLCKHIYHTPWGEFISSTDASKSSPTKMPFATIIRHCRNEKEGFYLTPNATPSL